MANGVLDYQRYLNTLQTLTEVGNIFPNEQKRWNYSVQGGGTQGWTATVSYETLILDKITYDRELRPVFDESTVVGYYTGTSITEYSTGTVVLPANMYRGGVLPASLVNVPLTVVNIRWVKDGSTYANNIGLIQNWEPGVLPVDPTLTEGFIPAVRVPSTLTLRGPGAVIAGNTITLQAETSVTDIDLGITTNCYFYWDNNGTNVLLGVAQFDRFSRIATLNYNTLGTQFTGGTYPIFAVFNGIRQYGRAVSNTLQQVVIERIPLIVTSEGFTPIKSDFLVGENITYSLNVVPDPAYPQSGNPVISPVTVKRTNLGVRPGPDTLLSSGTFFNGSVSVNMPVVSSMINTGASIETNDQVQITTSTLTTNTFAFTLLGRNFYGFKTEWADDYAAGYRSGSRNSAQTYAVYTTTNRLYTGVPFPITLRSNTGSYYTETTTFTVEKPAKLHGVPIRLIGTAVINGVTTTTTVANFPITLNPTTSVSVNTLQTGTWTLFASFPGDLGTGYETYRNNLASTSNSITHVVREGNDLNPIMTFERTADADIIRMTANYAGQLPRAVSFYQGEAFITTSNWVRNTSTVIVLNTATVDARRTINASLLSTERGWPIGGYVGIPKGTTATFFNVGGLYENRWPSYATLFRYKSSTETTSTYLANPIEPYSTSSQFITTGANVGYQGPFVKYGDRKGFNVISLTQKLPDYLPRDITFDISSFFESKTITLRLVEYLGVYQNIHHLYRFTPDIVAEDDIFYDVLKGGSRDSNLARWGYGPPGVQVDVPRSGGQYSISYTYWRDATNAPENTNYMDLNDGTIYIKKNTYTITRPTENGGFFTITYTSGWYSNYSYRIYDPTPSDFWTTYQRYINASNRVWNSPNPSDPVLSARYELARDFFQAIKNVRTGIANTATVTFQDLDTVFRNTNSIKITLPRNTIFNADILRATWPGTLDLPNTSGKFNSFEVYATLAPTTTTLYADPGISLNSLAPERFVSTATVSSLLYESPITGSIDLLNADTGEIIDTKTITEGNSTVFFDIYADDVTTNTNAPFINLKTRLNSTIVADSESPIIRLQALRTSFPNRADWVFDNWFGDGVFGKIETTITSFSKPLGRPAGNEVKLIGSVNVMMPPQPFRSLGSLIRASWYTDTGLSGTINMAQNFNKRSNSNPAWGCFDVVTLNLPPNLGWGFPAQRLPYITNVDFGSDYVVYYPPVTNGSNYTPPYGACHYGGPTNLNTLKYGQNWNTLYIKFTFFGRQYNRFYTDGGIQWQAVDRVTIPNPSKVAWQSNIVLG